ncbi:YjjG family noncanonical pyrimidine nucleotidase [Paenibacillus sp. FJAT-26967]|uniref:YjjG family noncanonical pyrimidine nucleotidase n=1 Tax=Paenibacillus sp. FJAT-26967 TaxID=1729690 RepID=UPI00083866E8|nr:YjjG family noncanonical pyrimidine nucleotidase [Paenibacillus sp. FJAT-26967]
MYKAILFDVDNTLLDYDLSELASMKQALAVHNLHNDMVWEEFWDTFRPINFRYWTERNRNNHHIREVLEYSFTDTFTQLQQDTSVSKLITETYWELFCNSCHLEPHAEDILEYLHGKVKLGIITNGIGEAQRRRLQAGVIFDYFDALIISDEVGSWKPENRIFQEALDRLDVHASEALFVGDSIHDDFAGAMRMGMDFCLYNPRRLHYDQHPKPAYTIHSLADLKNMLGG